MRSAGGPLFQEERRKTVRRKSDRLIREIQSAHDMRLEGQEFVQALHLIQHLNLSFGRREEDRELWVAFFKNLEQILNHFRELWIMGQIPRKVCLTKAHGKTDSKFPMGTERVGWEEHRPRIGEPYYLYKPNGGVFHTSRVTGCGDNHFRTANSTYTIKLLEEYTVFSDFMESLRDIMNGKGWSAQIIRRPLSGKPIFKIIK